MTTNKGNLREVFSDKTLATLFPSERADLFFDALFGDVDEGAYDIALGFNGTAERQLHFELRLHRRPGKCLACNLTYGLPTVFARHPVINVKKLVADIDGLLGEGLTCGEWRLGQTREVSAELHVVPLTIELKSAF